MSEKVEFEEHINPNLQNLAPSATLNINEYCDRLQQEGRDIIKLGLGQSPFPVPDPIVEELQKHAEKKFYPRARGILELREAIANRYRSRLGHDCSADDVLIGPGSKELMFILQMAYRDPLLIPTPTWVTYAPQARMLGKQIHTIDTSFEDKWHITPEKLEEFCETSEQKNHLLILNYPSNPTGLSLPHEHLKEIAEIARRHAMIILSDEIYARTHHRKGEHESIVKYYPEGTIFSSGLSKWCGAGGWRLGAFVFPEELRWLNNTMTSAISEISSGTCTPVQYAAIESFQDRDYIEEYTDHTRRVLGSLGGYLSDMLKRSGADITRPDGGFYLFPDFSPLKDKLHSHGIRSSEQMCERILAETDTAILPGSEFLRPPDEFTARVAYVDFDGEQALDASKDTHPASKKLNAEFLKIYCARTVEGVKRICDWMKKD
jgi:aspartate aminotransferase